MHLTVLDYKIRNKPITIERDFINHSLNYFITLCMIVICLFLIKHNFILFHSSQNFIKGQQLIT
jgi:small-conductance mechanosensitive channel